MPLKSGYSRETVALNIQTLIKEGKPKNQAIAIALEAARNSYFKRYPNGFLPTYLKRADGTRHHNPITNIKTLDNIKKAYLRAYAVYWQCYDRNDAQCMFKALKLMQAIQQKAPDYPFFPRFPKTRELEFNPEYRAKNPVPPSRKVQVRDAKNLYSNFTGHDGEVIEEIDKPDYPDALVVVGDCDGILYSTVRDGVHEKYIHKFHKDAKPLFCSAPDGSQIFFIGGQYDFTERGIVDRTDPKQQE